MPTRPISATSTRPAPADRFAWRWFAIIVLGPLVGGLVAAVIFTLDAIRIRGNIAAELAEVPAVLRFTLPLGWAAGLLPAILSAVLFHWVRPRLLGFGESLIAAVLIGAACSTVGVLPIFWFVFGLHAPDPAVLLIAAAAGAIALPLTALWGRGAR